MSKALLEQFGKDEVILKLKMTDCIFSHGDFIIVDAPDLEETPLDFESDEELLEELAEGEFTFTFVHPKLVHLLG